jgi:hypothetical protein
MNITAAVLQIAVRIIGPIMIILGLLFWSGNALQLIPLHMLIGITLVLIMWALAVLGAVAGLNLGFVALTAVWGLVIPILGLTQERLLTNSLHWLIQLLHLAVGLVALALADRLAAGIKARSGSSSLSARAA